MKLNFTFRHLDRSESLEKYTEQALSELQKILFNHEGLGHVVFSKSDHTYLVEASINTRIKYFRAQSNHDNIYQAVDEVVDKIEKQCLKIKQQVKGHKKKSLSKEGKLSQLNGQFEPRFDARRKIS